MSAVLHLSGCMLVCRCEPAQSHRCSIPLSTSSCMPIPGFLRLLACHWLQCTGRTKLACTPIKPDQRPLQFLHVDSAGRGDTTVHICGEVGEPAGQHAAREMQQPDEGRPAAAASGQAPSWGGAAPGCPQSALSHCCSLPARLPGEHQHYLLQCLPDCCTQAPCVSCVVQAL